MAFRFLAQRISKLRNRFSQLWARSTTQRQASWQAAFDTAFADVDPPRLSWTWTNIYRVISLAGHLLR